MTADAPHPDPSLPPPMDAVGGADALAEGGMLTSAGADDGDAPSPSLDAEQAEGRWGDDALLDLPRLPDGKKEVLASSKSATVEGVVARGRAAEAILEELARTEALGASGGRSGVRRRQRPQREPGFVLHARPWSESSMVVDVLTAHFGRVFLVARGAKRPGSNLRGLLTPFSPLALTWTGKKETKVLTQAEWLGALAALRDEALLSGFYVNELVLRLTEREDVHPGLFQSYVHVLSALADEDPAVRQTGLRSFEAELLAHCGWGLALEDRDLQKGAEWFLLTPEGALKGVEGTPEDAANLPFASMLWPKTVAAAAACGSAERKSHIAALSPREMKRLRELLKTAIDLHLEGRPLRSRRLLADLKKL